MMRQRKGVVTAWSSRVINLGLATLRRRQEMSLQQSSNTQQRPAQPVPAFGSVIDAQGREIPITEQMIQQACRELDNSRVNPVKKG